jgi:hypothetical protein
MKGGDVSSISPLVSFVLGAAMATVCVLFFMSASPTRRLADISAFSSGNATNDLRLASSDNAVADGNGEVTAPAPAPVEVRRVFAFLLSSLFFPPSLGRF